MSIRKSIALMSVLAAFVAVAEDAYLESGGTQYLPISHYMTKNSRIDLDFQMTVPLSGNYGDPASQVLGLFANTSNDAGTTGQYQSRMRVYSLKIYENTYFPE